jgi:RNA polymerase sigma-70 factor, ECF subfamily
MLFLILSALLAGQDDSDLIRRLKSRDPQAMSELYDRFGRVAFAVIVRMVRNTAIAEDLVQETFLKVWNRVSGFENERGALGSWVLAIARNRAIDYIRSADAKASQSTCDLEKLERPRFFADLESDYVNQDRIRTIRAVFDKLSENQRRVLELAYFEGLSQTEMSERLQQPLGTVKTWVRTALQTIRAELGDSVVSKNS